MTRIAGIASLGPVRVPAAVRRSDGSRGALFALLIVVGGTFFSARASAERTRTIVIVGDGCPSAELVRRMLAPLLNERVLVASEASQAHEDALQVRVEDRGSAYAIALRGSERVQADPARDCAERARVASVFVALNLQEAEARAQSGAESEPVAAQAEQAGATAASRAAEARVSSAATEASAQVPPVLHVGLAAWASVAFAPGRGVVAPGGAAGVFLERDAWRLQVSGGVSGPVTLPLSPREPGGSAQLARYPLSASVGYLWRASRFALEPRLGVAVDLLRLRARGVARSQAELRANAGLDFALTARIFLGMRYALLAGFGGAWFPRAYELRVEPAPRRAQSPEVWLAGQLGLEFMLR